MDQMNRFFFSAFLAVVPVTGFAGDWQTFSKFWGYVLTIEDQCASYASLTDAVMGNHLSGRDYDLAQAQVLKNRDALQARVVEVGCDAAAREAADMMGETMIEVWGVE
ncbi:hypothetical protein T8A63_10875 [Sulfitobacter sp. OXR-159]|uniref:hypothetical protein n=1 Tax=Sulfitobacter sp. OXR-159 TaxID=3100174 RepID=UPI002AC8B1F6|nr:hypothetical protein [Sulfitobacter sp. OXR-159]WPZ28163.1 hypothetical protein T8A63_10875 [Sulfitobacter sp. OXR-159]